METHPIFSKFKSWSGVVPAGFFPGYYGAIISDDFYQNEPHFYARVEDTGYPPADEELFEHIALLEAIDTAEEDFTMIELGAGYGRWMVQAAKAAKQRNLPCHFVGVEAEPGHYQMMIEHFLNNGIDPNNHRLIEAAVSDHDKEIRFVTGSPRASWGHKIYRDNIEWDPNWKEVKVVRAISLTTILRDLELVDLIDLDVQDEEYVILAAARDALCEKVKRIHIGTHGRQLERNLRILFGELGWTCEFNYPCNSETDTRYGRITFQDGVQDWSNAL